MRISAIAAIGEQRELGKSNKLLWHIPGELARFKRITTGHPIIMGRKTFVSIGKILPNRQNIIISKNKNFTVAGGFVVHSLHDAIEIARKNEEIFIIGGAQIFEQALPIVQRLYLTIIHRTFPMADVFFPDYSQFTKIVEKEDKKSDQYIYTFLTLER
jgi:dihydrofolate reductase